MGGKKKPGGLRKLGDLNQQIKFQRQGCFCEKVRRKVGGFKGRRPMKEKDHSATKLQKRQAGIRGSMVGTRGEN